MTVYILEEGEYYAINKGSTFGELALLHDKPRYATIQCVSNNNKIWVSNRNEFKYICDTYKNYNENNKHPDPLYKQYICNEI